MNKISKTDILSISFFLLVTTFITMIIFLSILLKNEITQLNNSYSNDLPLYNQFDNKLDYPRHVIHKNNYEKSFLMYGTIEDIDEDNNVIINFDLSVVDLINIKLEDDIIIKTVFGELKGKVDEIDNIVNNNFIKVITLTNSGDITLFKGMNVEGTIIYHIYEDVISIPKSFLIEKDNNFYVYKLNNLKNDYDEIKIMIIDNLDNQSICLIAAELKNFDIIVRIVS